MQIAEYRKTKPRLGHLTFWDTLATPNIMHLKNGALMACLQCTGVDLHSAPDSALLIQAARLNSLFRRFGGGWAIMTEARRREVTSYPAATWPDPVSAAIDAQRKAHCSTPGTHYRTEMFLTLIQQQTASMLGDWKHLLYTNLPEDTAADDSLEHFEEEIQRTTALLRDCCRQVTRLENSAFLTYLHSTVSHKTYTVGVPHPPCYLDTYIAGDTDLERPHRFPSLLRWPRLGARWVRCVGVKAYPAASQPGMLDALEQLPLEYRACIRYLPLERSKAISELRRARNNHYGQRQTVAQKAAAKMGSPSDLVEQSALDFEREANQAQADVTHNRVSYGYLTQTVVVWDPDFDAATQKAQQVEEALNAAQFTAKVETLNTMDAWVGTLPGDTYANVRRPLLNSTNLSHLLPLQIPWSGEPWNAHLKAPALLRATGRGHIPFDLDTYDGDLGHTFVAGRSGSGKSTLVNLMALQWRRYANAQVSVFEIGESFRCATYAVGGQWFDVGAEVSRVFNADGHLDDADFHPWAGAWAPPDGSFQCFELGSLMKTPTIVPGVIRAIFQAIESRLTGTPHLIVFDEAWQYLKPLSGVDKDPHAFTNRIESSLRTLRKLNGCVIFSSQSLEDMAQSPLATIIAETCPTRIYLANPRALEPKIAALYEGYGLNERQRDIIAALVPKRSYYFQGTKGHQVFELNLSPLELAFIGAGRKEDLAKMADIYKSAPEDFPVLWLHERGLHTEAETLRKTMNTEKKKALWDAQ